MGRLSLVLVCALAAWSGDLEGVVDVHMHCDPDSMPRSVDALDTARLARDRGLRAIILKNHYQPTAQLAYAVEKITPGLRVFGGIALNRAVGGLNSVAVENMARTKGAHGRVVWMPTFDAENQVRKNAESRPFVPVAKEGQLLPETGAILDLIGKYNLVLATGHSSPEEALLLIRAARARGIRRILVTHAMLAPVSMTVDQMREAAREGASLEFVSNVIVGRGQGDTLKQYAEAIRAVGPPHCILSSDLGQPGNPLHADGLAAFIEGLRKDGFSSEELALMTRVNPARLLGLD